MNKQQQPLRQQIARLERAAVPLLAITCTDQPAALREIVAGRSGAVVVWTISDGIAAPRAADQAAAAQLQGFAPQQFGGSGCPTAGNPAAALAAARAGLPPGGALVLCGGLRIMSDDWACAMACVALRDEFAANGKTLILLGHPYPLPVELRADCYTLDAPKPDRDALRAVCAEIAAAAETPLELAPADLDSAAEALAGLGPFAAEQAAALALTPNGFDAGELWRRKREQIESTEGLEIVPPADGIDWLRGVDGLAEFYRDLATCRPGAVVQLDEIEKALAGTGSDSSGTSQQQLGALLSWWEDRDADGLCLLGPPGTGKTASSVALGSLCGVPTIRVDLARCQGHGLVGQAGHAIAEALRVIDAVAAAAPPFIIATSNRMAHLPAALKRRFTAGVWFADLPGADVQVELWQQYADRYGVPLPTAQPAAWTGAEIRNACRWAGRLRISTDAALRRITPVSSIDAAGIEELRQEAERSRYKSAATGDDYRREQPHAAAAKGRKVTL